MTLSFSQKINNKETYFVEKIISGLHAHKDFKGFKITKNYDFNFDILESCKSKIHTLRWDESNRWKAGNKIHFVINNRTSKRYQFYPVVYCVSIQEVWISPSAKTVKVWDESRELWRLLSNQSVEILSQNDGFDTLDDFWSFFKDAFGGKIIHWTDFKY